MTLGALFHCCSFSPPVAPLVTQVEKGFRSGRQNMVSSEQKTVSIVFRTELTAVDELAARAVL